MKRNLTLALLFMILGLLPDLTMAGGRGRPNFRSGAGPRGNVPQAWVDRGVPGYRYGYPRHSYYYYPNGYYYQPFYPPTVVISPYGPTYYYQPRVVEVTAPYFCVLHNSGFVTRAGMVDHLAGTHKFALENAAQLCPEGVHICLFPIQ